jgi:hypothetical protein
MQMTDSWLRWERLTWVRVISAVGWIMGTSAFGLYFVYMAGFAGGGFMGVPATAEILRTGARLMITGTGLIAVGPFGVWLLRRRRLWLLIGLAVLAIGSALSLTYWIESPGAPSLRETV